MASSRWWRVCERFSTPGRWYMAIRRHESTENPKTPSSPTACSRHACNVTLRDGYVKVCPPNTLRRPHRASGACPAAHTLPLLPAHPVPAPPARPSCPPLCARPHHFRRLQRVDVLAAHEDLLDAHLDGDDDLREDDDDVARYGRGRRLRGRVRIDHRVQADEAGADNDEEHAEILLILDHPERRSGPLWWPDEGGRREAAGREERRRWALGIPRRRPGGAAVLDVSFASCGATGAISCAKQGLGRACSVAEQPPRRGGGGRCRDGGPNDDNQ